MNSDDRSGVRDKVSLQARQGRFMVLYTIKKITLLLLLILLGSAVSMAQTYELWGTTTGGGQNGKGTIFKTDGAGNNHQVIHDFSVGQYPTGFLLLASDGIIYGTTRFGGDSTNYGTIFSIDPKNGQFTKLYDFVKKNGLQPHGNLVEGASGILYGTAAGGSSGDGGVIFSYNPANGTYTKLYSFGTGKDGKNPTTGLELAWDGKYYGATKFGGKNNQGVIYSFDAATNVYSKRLDLSHSKTGTGPSGNLVQGFQGNKDLLYGVNHNGGTSNLGTLFILNLKKNTLTVKHNFTNKSGSAPYGPILETTNGIVYGMTHRGGKYDKGVIYRYGYYLNDYKVKHNFNDTHGRAPSGGFILASNGKLYGLTYGSNVKPAVNGTLIEYDTLTNTVTKKVEFSGINGFRPMGNLIEIESCVDFDTLAVSACDSYTSPSGNYTWNTSGTYMDTLINAAGCDSILTIELSISGCIPIQLVDEIGVPLANFEGTYRSRCGGSWAYNNKSFTTDANGFAFLNTTCAANNWDGKITLTVNQTSREQDVAVNSVFQLSRVDVNLNTCNPTTPLTGGVVDQGGGFWFNQGTTDAGGTVSFYAFDGNNVKVRMKYNVKGSQTQSGVPVTFPVTNIDFTTTTVTLNYPGTIQINAGGWPVITSPIELLPGNYIFRLDGNQTGSITISGCDFGGTPIYMQLQNSLGSGLTDADFQYRFGWGGYTTIGTDLSGVGLWYFLPGNAGNTKVKVTYNGASKEMQQNVQSNPMFIFNTVNVTADLGSSVNTDLTAGATWQYRFGWGSYSSFDPVGGIELLPVNTKVKVTYEGASLEKQQNTRSNSQFHFQTELVKAVLRASDGMTDLTAAATFQYRYGWGSYNTLDPMAGKELLPVNTKVKVSYDGASLEKQQNVSSDATFYFHTVNVTARLLESDNATDITGSANWQYRYGWGSYTSIGDPATGVELLPVNTKVKVTYNGASIEKQQNTKSDASFEFNTVKVTAHLLESDNTTDITGSANWQYRYGWGSYTSIGDPATGVELLPVNTKVKVTYNGASIEKQQNTKSDASFDYNTVSVTATLMDGVTDITLHPGTTWQYRYGWGAYSTLDPTGEELLPVNTKVKVSYLSSSDEKQQNVNTAPHFIFTYNGSDISRIAGNSTDPSDNFNGSGVEGFTLSGNQAFDIIMFPNPGYDYVTIESKHPIQIFNISGQLIYHGVAGRIDVAEWPDGLYLVKTPYTTKWLQVQ